MPAFGNYFKIFKKPELLCPIVHIMFGRCYLQTRCMYAIYAMGRFAISDFICKSHLHVIFNQLITMPFLILSYTILSILSFLSKMYDWFLKKKNRNFYTWYITQNFKFFFLCNFFSRSIFIHTLFLVEMFPWNNLNIYAVI